MHTTKGVMNSLCQAFIDLYSFQIPLCKLLYWDFSVKWFIGKI